MEKNMKPIEEMTLSEIRELKEKYRDEFKELVKKFLEDRPMIDDICLYRPGIGWYASSINIGLDLYLGVDIVNDVKLKGEKI